MVDALKVRFDSRCSTALAVREQHGRRVCFDVPSPLAVIFAESTRDVADALALASGHKVPEPSPRSKSYLLVVKGDISIDVSRMNHEFSVDAGDLTVTM